MILEGVASTKDCYAFYSQSISSFRLHRLNSWRGTACRNGKARQLSKLSSNDPCTWSLARGRRPPSAVVWSPSRAWLRAQVDCCGPGRACHGCVASSAQDGAGIPHLRWYPLCGCHIPRQELTGNLSSAGMHRSGVPGKHLWNADKCCLRATREDDELHTYGVRVRKAVLLRP